MAGILERTESLIDKMLRRIGYTKASRTLAGLTDWDVKFPPDKYQDYSSYLEAMKYHAWVNACVNIRANALAMVDGWVQNQKDEEVKSGLVDLLNKPNEQESRYELFYLTQLFLDLTGNAFWELDQVDRNGRPKAIYVLEPQNMVIFKDKQNFIAGYGYKVNEKTIPFDTKEILHFKYPNPYDKWWGLGKIESAILTLDTDYYAQRMNENFFKRAGQYGTVVSIPEVLDGTTFKQLKEQFRQEYEGYKNSWRTMFLQGGGKVEPPSAKHTDMMFLEQRKFTRDEILAMFGVPPAKISILENANYSNSEEQDKTFWSETMRPVLRLWEGKLNQLAARYGQGQIWTFEEVSKKNEKLMADIADIYLRNFVMTPNEIREMLGYEPHALGGNIFLPVNLIPVDAESGREMDPLTGQEAVAPAPAPEPAPGTAPGTAAAPAEGQEKGQAEPQKQAKVKPDEKTGSPGQEESLQARAKEGEIGEKAPAGTGPAEIVMEHFKSWEFRRNFLRMATREKVRISREADRKMKRYFTKQEGRILDNFYDITKAIGWYDKKSKKSQDDTIRIIINGIYPPSEQAILNEEMKEIYKGGISASGKTVNEAYGTYLQTSAEAAWVARRAKGLLVKFDRRGYVTDTTRAAIEEQIRIGIGKGYTYTQIAEGVQDDNYKGISGVFSEGEGYRSEMIARTEANNSFDQATLEGYGELGVEVIDVIGCEDDVPDCNATNVPIEEAEQLEFHPNHTGTIVPAF